MFYHMGMVMVRVVMVMVRLGVLMVRVRVVMVRVRVRVRAAKCHALSLSHTTRHTFISHAFISPFNTLYFVFLIIMIIPRPPRDD